MEDHGKDIGMNRRAPRRPTRLPLTSGSPSRAKIKVTIPIYVGGYVGQRDQWQEQEDDYVVTVAKEGDTITLTSPSDGAIIRFDKSDLDAALRALGMTGLGAYRGSD